MLGSQRLSNSPEACSSKQLLLRVLERETREFAEAVTHLNERRSTANGADYHQLGVVADRARMRAEEARLILYRHIEDHGC
jgi:hypothetical protein